MDESEKRAEKRPLKGEKSGHGLGVLFLLFGSNQAFSEGLGSLLMVACMMEQNGASSLVSVGLNILSLDVKVLESVTNAVFNIKLH